MNTYITTTVVIYIIGILVLFLMIIYFYNEYKKLKEEDRKNKKDIYYSNCPDYWESVGEGKCKNTFKLGKCALDNNSIMDFNDDIFKNTDGNYAKCKWAKSCDTYWANINKLC